MIELLLEDLDFVLTLLLWFIFVLGMIVGGNIVWILATWYWTGRLVESPRKESTEAMRNDCIGSPQ